MGIRTWSMITSLLLSMIGLVGCTSTDAAISEDKKATTNIIQEDYQKTENPDMQYTNTKGGIHAICVKFVDADSFATDDVHGRYLPLFIHTGMQTNGGKTAYFKLNPAKDQLPKSGQIFHLYKDGKYVDKATLLQMPYATEDDDGESLDPGDMLYNLYDSYGLQFANKDINLDAGYYFIIQNNAMASPRQVKQLDEHGSFSVDLYNTGEDNILMVAMQETEGSDEQNKYATIDGKAKIEGLGYVFEDVSAEDGFSPEEIEAIDLEYDGMFGAYDLDQDGILELVIYSLWPGGENIEILSFVNGAYESQYFSGSEEEIQFNGDGDQGSHKKQAMETQPNLLKNTRFDLSIPPMPVSNNSRESSAKAPPHHFQPQKKESSQPSDSVADETITQHDAPRKVHFLDRRQGSMLQVEARMDRKRLFVEINGRNLPQSEDETRFLFCPSGCASLSPGNPRFRGRLLQSHG